MTNLRLYADIFICVCTGIGFIYGMIRCFGKDCPMFLKAIIGAMGCAMGGRLFALTLQLCGGVVSESFNIGYIGLAGCFQFLFSASHGEIDDRIKPYKSKMSSHISLISTVPVIVLFIMIIRTKATVQYKILGAVVSFFVLCCALCYFKYMIMRDGGDGLIKMFRPCAVLITVFTYSQVGEIFFTIRHNSVMLIVTYLFIGIIGLVLVPLTERRVHKWMNI